MEQATDQRAEVAVVVTEVVTEVGVAAEVLETAVAEAVTAVDMRVGATLAAASRVVPSVARQGVE